MSAGWPDGARAGCLITVSFDAELAVLALDSSAATRQKSLSVGRYGATRGVQRLLGVLADRGLPSSWFVPAQNALCHASLVAEVIAEGHELATSGVALENFGALGLREQHQLVTRAREVVEQRHGVRTVGFRPGRGDADPRLAGLLRPDGYTWSSQSRGDDLPVTLPSGLVDLPHHHELDDAAYFAFNLDPPIPLGSPRIAPIGDVLANWTIEFDAHRDEGLLFVLDLHPELIGTPARAAMLGELLDRVVEVGDVWVATGAVIAQWWIGRVPAAELPADHPVTVFDRHAQPAAGR
ncbi:MAG: polysaccharide deacetylase family protein [Micropruina sp.]|uniref:polysaccharide deacetylase family protein n=1 Tax=Micropruina sp. TaxID=2737536 RepID=UPI0039E5B789